MYLYLNIFALFWGGLWRACGMTHELCYRHTSWLIQPNVMFTQIYAFGKRTEPAPRWIHYINTHIHTRLRLISILCVWKISVMVMVARRYAHKPHRCNKFGSTSICGFIKLENVWLIIADDDVRSRVIEQLLHIVIISLKANAIVWCTTCSLEMICKLIPIDKNVESHFQRGEYMYSSFTIVCASRHHVLRYETNHGKSCI